MTGLSLRTRLLAGVGLVAVVLVVVAVVITASTRTQLIDQLDERLLTAASDNRGSVLDRNADNRRNRPGERNVPGSPPERQSDFYEGSIRQDGTLVTFFVPNVGGEESSPPDISSERIDANGGATLFTAPAEDGGLEYRVLVQPTPDGAGAFVTALPLDDVERTVTRLRLIVVGAVAVVLAVLGLVTWWMLRLGIRPIKQMTTTATAIAAGDLSARADESSEAAESREMAVALNTMMGTIETAMAEREESESRLRRFVSDASHELRTPVTTIRGYAELYRAGGLSDRDDLDDAMRRMEAESARMARLIEDMLVLAKLDEQRPIERRPVDLAQLARDAIRDARASAPDRPLTVVAPGTAEVIGDDDRLRQVFANLINNALTHTGRDVAVSVTVHEPADGRIVFEVADDGDGMSADIVDRITERFFRADPSRARSRGGSGLGLAIVDATVAAHGGTIRISSGEGDGTTVTVDLPAAAGG